MSVFSEVVSQQIPTFFHLSNQVIFARADSDFRSLEDLRRARVEAVSLSGLGAMQLQQAEPWWISGIFNRQDSLMFHGFCYGPFLIDAF